MTRTSIALALATLVGAAAAVADTTNTKAYGAKTKTEKTDKHAAKVEKTAAAPQMTKEEMDAMKAWEAAATPGEAHAKLEPFAGTFKANVTSWMKPGAPPEVSTGRSVTTWILGERWLEQRFDGTFMGAPFTGIAYTGYDNVQKKYVSTWMDSMSTGMMTSTGDAGPGGKTFTFTGTHFNPMTGKECMSRQVTKLDGNDRHVMEFFGPDTETGKEYKMMEIVYERVGVATGVN